MKKYLLAICLCLCTYIAQAQKVDVCKDSNGILLINTTDYELKLQDDFKFFLEKYNNGANVQYFLRGQSETNEAHSFPENAKLLFKLSDGSVVELTSYYNYIDYDKDHNDYTPTSYYPITEEQLQSLFGGIIKVRVEMLSIDKDDVIFQDFQDVDFKKDKLGNAFKKMYDAIANQEIKLSEQTEKASTVRNASDGF